MSFLEALLGDTKLIFKQLGSHADNLINKKKPKEFDPESPTAVLLHGYFIGKGSLVDMRDFLGNEGFNVKRESYPYWKHPKEVEDLLIPKLETIAELVGDKISLVGHSQGGLIACGIGQRCPGLINRVISLGMPYQGTHLATFNFFIPGAKEMMIGSEYILEINAREFPKEVEFYSIYSNYDEAVIPQRNAIIPYSQPNIHNIEIGNGVIGHLGLIGNEVMPLVVELLGK